MMSEKIKRHSLPESRRITNYNKSHEVDEEFINNNWDMLVRRTLLVQISQLKQNDAVKKFTEDTKKILESVNGYITAIIEAPDGRKYI